MARRKSQGQGEQDEERELVFPSEGVDQSKRHHTAHSRHTVSAQNVRGIEASTDRMRGGSRPGLAKYIATQVNGDKSIQDINHLALAYFDPAAGIGQALLGRQTTAGTAAFTLLDTDGAVIASAGTAARRYEGAVWDDEGNCYVATQDTANVLLYLQKIDTAGAVAWTVQPITFRTSNIVHGMVAEDGILYVFARNTTAGAVNDDQIFRFNASDGSAYGGTALWKDITDLVLPGQTRNSINSRLAYSNGVLGLLVLTSGAVWAVRFIDVSDGTVLSTVTLTGAVRFLYDLAADHLGNFYALGEDDLLSICYFSKVSSSGSGSQVWSKSTASSAAMTGVAYDRKNNRLGVVGADVLGTGLSFSTVAVATGLSVAASDAGGETDWYGIAYDGAGGFVLGRGAGTNDFSGLGEDLVEDWAIDNTALYERYAIAVNYREDTSPTGNPSRRRIRGVVVAGGTVKTFSEGVLESVTDGTLALSLSAPVIFSAQNGVNLYFADGVSTKYYDSAARAVSTWTPTAGSLPVDGVGNRPRLICTWRGRTVLAGLLRDPQNWFMSAVNNPLDYDYAPASATPTQAVAGNSSQAGMVGDLVNCLLPYTDDALIFGGDHTIHVLQGDPMAGGQLDLITNTIGMAYGRPYTMDPAGGIYFFGSRGGVYRMTPGSTPLQLNTRIVDALRDVDWSDTLVRMVWDDRDQGLYLFITSLSQAATTHWYWDSRNDAWWPLVFGNSDHSPKAVHVYDGDDPADRVLLLGCQDGYLRQFDEAAEDDDGTAIESFVVIGPLSNTSLDDFILKDLQAVLDDASGGVTATVHVGRTAQSALAADPVETFAWGAGRNYLSPVRRSGYGVYVKLASEERWVLEVIRMKLRTANKVRRRGF
jgi:hypothetical protein